MMKTLFPIFLLSLLALFGDGCAIFSSASSDESQPPVFAIYHAYPRMKDAPENLTPVPAYTDVWPEERQRRDIARVRETKIQGLLLFIQPKDLANTERFQLLERFLAKAEDASLSIILGLQADSPMRLHSDDMVKFMEKRGLLTHPALFRLDGKLLLVLSENMLLAGSTPSSLTVRKISVDWIPSEEDPMLTGDGFCWIAAARYQDGQWLSKRKPRVLRSRLQKASILHPAAILLSSWNCYQDGSAIEFNSLDGDAFLKIL